MEQINWKRAQTPPPGMQRTAALCGLGALAYLAAESALSGLLGPSVDGLPPAAGKRAQTPPPGMQRTAALCGLGALAYLAAESALSGLLGPSVDGLPPAAGELVALGKNLLALAAPFLLVLACPPRAPVRLRRPRRGMLPVLFVLFWGLTMAGNLASSGLRALLGEAGGAELADAPVALVWLRLALVPAAGEELLFRGLMQGYLRPWGSRAAVWGQAVLFALLHGDAPA